MQAIDISGTFEQTAAFQAKYHALLAACDATGTMVLQDRFLEHDTDIAPHDFFRKGTRIYVFPKQKVKLVADTSKVVDPTPEYRLRSEQQAFDYIDAAVKGRLSIKYEDANNRPHLTVDDTLGNGVHNDSVLPPRVRKVLDDIVRASKSSPES